MRPQAKLKNSFVYVHLEADTGTPFYVGMGIKKARPWELSNRTKYHKQVTKKHGLRVEVVVDDLDWETAKFWEIRWIKALRETGYRLVNLTDGGDGTRGYKHTKKYCQQISNRMRKNNPMKDPKIASKYSGNKHHAKTEAHKTKFLELMTTHKDIIVDRMINNNPMKNPVVAKLVASKNRGRKHSAESVEASAQKRRGIRKTEEQKKASGAGVKRYWERITDDERLERGTQRRLAHAKITAAQRSEIIKKGHETRRRNKLLNEGIA